MSQKKPKNREYHGKSILKMCWFINVEAEEATETKGGRVMEAVIHPSIHPFIHPSIQKLNPMNGNAGSLCHITLSHYQGEQDREEPSRSGTMPKQGYQSSL